MFFVVKKDKPFDPAGICALGTNGIMLQTHDIADLIKQFARLFLIITFLLLHLISQY